MIFLLLVLLFAELLLTAAAREPLLCGPQVPKQTRCRPFLMQETPDDDSDVKIAGDRTEKKPEDTLSEANELRRQRRCGNLEKARALGAALSDKIIDEDGEYGFGLDSEEDDKIRMQRRMLLAFTAYSAVQRQIASDVLKGVILNVFYDALKNSLPQFYDDIIESGSFSFYTLCIRRGKDTERCVGETFAMLCGKEGDQISEDLGEALYFHFEDVTFKTIASFKIIQ